MKDKITYLFGAGASAKVIPIYSKSSYNNFTQELKEFVQNFILQNSSINNKFRPPFSLLNQIEKILKDSEEEDTLDYLARTYHLRNDMSSDYKLIILKCLISLFIQYKQSYLTQGKINRDKRYENLLSKILVPSNPMPIIPKEISFLTWNYDNQLELALAHFSQSDLSLENICLKYEISPSSIDLVQNKIDYSFYRHIKLNGHAGYFIFPDSLNVTHKIRTYHDSDGINDFQFRIEQSLLPFTNMTNNLRFLINFAWEYPANVYSNLAVKNALNVIANTDKLIIIGYSFPDFNENIDRMLLSKIKPHSTIYYQTNESNSQKEEMKIYNLLSGSRSETCKIIHSSEVDEFKKY